MAGSPSWRDGAASQHIQAGSPSWRDGAVAGSGCSAPGSVAERLGKEVDFQSDKRRKRKFEAYQLGNLAESDMSDGFEDEAQAFSHHEAKLDRAAERQKELKHEKTNPMRLRVSQIQQQHLRIFIDPGAASSALTAATSDLRVTMDVEHADIFVVHTLLAKDLTYKVMWAAMLLGSYMILPDFFTAQNHATVKYQATIGCRRILHITQGFKSHHPKLAEMLQGICRLQKSKWTLINTAALFQDSWQRSGQVKRSQHITLRVKDEKTVPGLNDAIRKFHLKEFHNHICRWTPSARAPPMTLDTVP